VQRAGLARGGTSRAEPGPPWPCRGPPGPQRGRPGVGERRAALVGQEVKRCEVRADAGQVQPPAGEVTTRSYALTMAIVVVCCLVRHGGVLVGHLDVWAGRLSGGARPNRDSPTRLSGRPDCPSGLARTHPERGRRHPSPLAQVVILAVIPPVRTRPNHTAPTETPPSLSWPDPTGPV
jgi:hypothetical protein